jgi:hypothetical protein
MKEILIPILIIVVVAGVLFLAFLPLQNSTWAEDIRSRPSHGGSSDALIEDTDASLVADIIRIVDGLLKVVLFMGIPGWITWRILKRNARRSQKISTRTPRNVHSS